MKEELLQLQQEEEKEMVVVPAAVTEDNITKGKHACSQLALWDAIMDTRIRLQVCCCFSLFFTPLSCLLFECTHSREHSEGLGWPTASRRRLRLTSCLHHTRRSSLRQGQLSFAWFLLLSRSPCLTVGFLFSATYRDSARDLALTMVDLQVSNLGVYHFLTLSVCLSRTHTHSLSLALHLSLTHALTHARAYRTHC
jgi:hypothetical protein